MEIDSDLSYPNPGEELWSGPSVVPLQQEVRAEAAERALEEFRQTMEEARLRLVLQTSRSDDLYRAHQLSLGNSKALLESFRDAQTSEQRQGIFRQIPDDVAHEEELAQTGRMTGVLMSATASRYGPHRPRPDVPQYPSTDDDDPGPLTTDQESLLESLFGAGFPKGHPFCRAILNPIIPDEVMEDEATLPYDLDWMAIHGVPDDYLKGWNSSSHAARLFQQKALKIGDELRWSVRTGLTERTDRRVSLCSRILNLGNSEERPVNDIARGLRALMDAVARHFGDPILRRSTNYYKEISVERHGVDLGTLHDIRKRFTLWDALIQSFHERTDRRFSRREFKGRTSHLAVVLQKRSGRSGGDVA
ncbi:MAG: hypothetical protein Q9212_005543 [Teloschistes hypoglaucus]